MYAKLSLLIVVLFLFENIPRQTFKRILATAQPGGFCLRLASSRPISLRWARQILLGHFCLAFVRLKSSVDNYLAGSKKCSLFASLRNLCKFFGLFSQYLITCILWFHGQSACSQAWEIEKRACRCKILASNSILTSRCHHGEHFSYRSSCQRKRILYHQMSNDMRVQNDIQTPDTRPSRAECDLHFIWTSQSQRAHVTLRRCFDVTLRLSICSQHLTFL